MEQLNKGIKPSMVTFNKGLPVIRNCSIKWLVNGYEAINKPDLVKKVMFKNILSFLHI